MVLQRFWMEHPLRRSWGFSVPVLGCCCTVCCVMSLPGRSLAPEVIGCSDPALSVGTSRLSPSSRAQHQLLPLTSKQ